MTTKFPAEIDQFENPRPNDSQAQARTHSDQHGDANDAIEAVQRKVGVDGSSDPDALDFKVGALENLTEALDSAAYQPVTAFATANQGLKADSAIQADQLAAATGAVQQELQSQIDGLVDGQQTQAIYANTLPDLQAVSGTYVGQGAFVLNGTGAGQYRWNGTAWEFLRSDMLAAKANTADVNAALVNKTDALPGRRRSTGILYRHSTLNRSGKVVHGVDRDFRHWLKNLGMFSNTMRHRSPGGGLFSIGDEVGNRLFLINDKGHADFRPSDALLDFIADHIGNGPTPVVRGVASPFDVRASSDITRAMTVNGGWCGEVQQPRNGIEPVAVSTSHQPVVGVHHFGQSNAGGGGVAVAVLKDPKFIHHALTFSVGKQQYGDAVVDPATLNELKPLADDSLRPFPGVTTAYALEAVARAHGESSPATFSRTDWQGSMPLGSFVRGTSNWTNLMASIAQAIAVCRSYARDYQPHVVWVQGEAGPDGREIYASQLNSLIDDARSEVRSNHQKEMPWLIWQICYSQAVTRGVTLAHRDVARGRTNSNTVLVAPTYSLPFVNLDGDVTHYSTLGRMMQGELTALALRSIERTGTWQPLDVRSISRNGSTIVVDLHNPGGPILFDTDWVEAIANFGFSFSDSTGSATVSQVAITGRNQITVTLSAVPSGNNKVLRYGLVAQAPADAKWSPYRGQVYAPSGERSPFAAMGYGVPNEIRFYLPIFEEAIV